MTQRALACAALAAVLCAAGFHIKGFDLDFPDAWPDSSYRQVKINEQLKRLGWPYRVYQSPLDGSCLAVRYSAERAVESLHYDDGPSRGPSLAFGCVRLAPGARQELSIYGDTIMVERDDGELFAAAEDPYRIVGRYESGPGRLEIYDRARVAEILRRVHRAKGNEYTRRVERELAEKIHSMGDNKMGELTAESDEGKWRYWVQIEGRRPGDSPQLFYEDGQELSAAANSASEPDDEDDGQ